MQYLTSVLLLSATDLSNFLGCRYRTALEMNVAADILAKPYHSDPLMQILVARGLAHEKGYVEELRGTNLNVVDLAAVKETSELGEATLEAMRDGADIIVQGVLLSSQWIGKPDLLLRIPGRSAFGSWCYEVADTKLARDTGAGTILQLGLYSELLAIAQQRVPEFFRVLTPDPAHRVHSFRVNDYSAYVRLVSDQLAATVLRGSAEIAASYYPEPVELCHICPWITLCTEKRNRDDHLSLVANISRTQRRELESRGTRTLADLGRLPLPLAFKPDRGSIASYVRAREQARLQFDSRDKTPPLHELLDIALEEGFCRLPEPSPGDLFLDLEGDNVSFEGGREYLFGLVSLSTDGQPVYSAYWGLTDIDERKSFEAVIDLIDAALAAHPGMHVYHYAPYETTAFKRLMGRYATRESSLESFLRGGRFVDLYAVVRQGLRAGIERYSIKNLEPLYGFLRAVPLDSARRGLRAFEYALAIGDVGALTIEVRGIVEGYNRDDCVSTFRLRDWLEELRRGEIDKGKEIPRREAKPSEPSEALTEHQQQIEALRAQLVVGINDVPAANTIEHARWLLAQLLDFHRRENKAGWWRFFTLCDSTDEELIDEKDAIAGLVHDRRVEIVLRANSTTPTGSVIDRYSYPLQEMEIRRGGKLKTRDKLTFGEVVAVDRSSRTIDVKKGKAQADAHPTAFFTHAHVSTNVLEEAIAVVGQCVAGATACDGANGIARTLLLREVPRLKSGAFLQPKDAHGSDFAVSIVGELRDTVLAIQGPPGSGKTYTGARMICALVEQGKKVGIMASSHKVISNLLAGVSKESSKRGSQVRIAQKTLGDDGDAAPDAIAHTSDNGEALRLLANRETDVLGGTAFMWARADFVSSVDVLFVDEAGQVSLANAIAVSAAANSMVMLGDPQQLDQPQQGSHPDGVELSALQHMLGSNSTMPPDRGIFLEETWRLSPAICAFTSEVFYESRLKSRDDLGNQALTGVAELSGNALWCIDVEHDGRTSSSDEEVEVIVALVARLASDGSRWINDKKMELQLTRDDVLIISPFNAQVNRLVERLPAGARVGTVDKFQGQEAPIVIYSMATSRPEDAPRGMEFLYSRSRLNVATSRAKCAVIIVANARLYAPECHSASQMKLANALCRYREMAVVKGRHRQ
jgi:predicted RecB family nuclease